MYTYTTDGLDNTKNCSFQQIHESSLIDLSKFYMKQVEPVKTEDLGLLPHGLWALGKHASGTVLLLQLRHVRTVNHAVLTHLCVSGCLPKSVLQNCVEQGYWDWHCGKYDEQSQKSQSPIRIVEVFLCRLEESAHVITPQTVNQH